MTKRPYKNILLKILRFVLKFLAVILAVCFLVITLVNIPAVQTYITGRISGMLQEQYGVDVRLGAVKIAIPDIVNLEDVFIAGRDRDTLLYAGAIRINARLLKLLRNEVYVSSLKIDSLKGDVFRGPPGSDYNFMFLVNAFTSGNTENETPPDTSSSWKISVGKIAFSNFDIKFRDETLGMDTRLILGSLDIYIKSIDLEKPGFFIRDIMLMHTTATLTQWDVEAPVEPDLKTGQPGSTSENSEGNSYPGLGLDKLLLQDVKFNYNDQSSEMKMDFVIGDLLFEPEKIDLAAQNLQLGKLSLSRSGAKIETSATLIPDSLNKAVATDTTLRQELSIPEILPGWDLGMDKAEFSEIWFDYDIRGAAEKSPGPDFNHLGIQQFDATIQNMKLKGRNAGFEIANFSLKEKSGFQLEQLALKAEVTETGAGIRNFRLISGKTSINASVSATFSSIDSVIRDPGSAIVSFTMDDTDLYSDDIFSLAGISRDDSLFGNYQNLNVHLDAEIQGKVDSLNIHKFVLAMMDQTTLDFSGSIRHITTPDSLSFRVEIKTLTTGRNDVTKLAGQYLPPGIVLPDELRLQLSAQGSYESVTAGLDFRSNFGNFTTEAFYHNQTPHKRDSVNLELTLTGLDAGKFIADTVPGKITLSLMTSGSGFSTDSVSARLNGFITEANYNNYRYRNVDIEASMEKQFIEALVKSGDPNANFTLEATANLDSASRKVNAELNLNLLNLYKLNFSSLNTGISTKLAANGTVAGINNLSLDVGIKDTRIITDAQQIDIPDIFIYPDFNGSQTNFKLTSEIANLDLKSNIPVEEIGSIFSVAMDKFLGINDTISLPDGKNIDFTIDIDLPGDLRSQILPGLNEIKLDPILGSYRSSTNSIMLNLSAPVINWNQTEVHNLKLNISGQHDSLTMVGGFENLVYDTIYAGTLEIQQVIKNGNIDSRISILGTGEAVNYNFENVVKISDEGVKISFKKDGLTMNKQPWDVDPENYLEIKDDQIIANKFMFSNGIQQVGLKSINDQQKIIAENFELANLLNVLQIPSRKRILEGDLDAVITLPMQQKPEGINAKLAIRDLYFLDSLVGNINFNLKEYKDQVNLSCSMINAVNEIKAEGYIMKTDYPQPVNFNIAIQLTHPEKLEVFALGNISQTSGDIRGNLKIGGNLEEPDIDGFIQLKNTRVRINKLNFLAGFENEKISFNKNGIQFDHFTITDANQHKLVIDGSLLTTDYKDFAFDLSVNTENLQPINSTKNDNNVFYGSLIIDTDLTLKGDLALPVVDANVSIQEGTDLTYVLPGSEIEFVSTEGIVNFVDPKATQHTNNRSGHGDFITDSIISKVSGLNLDLNLTLDPKAKFTLIIDPYSGDYASVSGSAVLNFSADVSGSQTLTGVFEVTDGIYQLSFYGLVKKTFTFEPGSSIAWSGRPMDANMNITAKNVVRTQSLALIANETSGMTEAEQNMFKQRLPYEVLLHLRGFIDDPNVGFSINLPEKYQINYPQVASKLTLLNSGQNDSELNKQVFALLVTGSFIADNPFASTGGNAEQIATTAARNSVNGILAGQLNRLSNRYIKGVDMNFGLTTYEDYSGTGSETRTELDVQVSKKLLNDRLTVEASGSFDIEGNRQYTSTSTSHTYGEFSATYDLTENQEYKLKAYRENAYDLFDGEISYSGIAFIIEKSFDALLKRNRDKWKNKSNQPKNSKDQNPKTQQPE